MVVMLENVDGESATLDWKQPWRPIWGVMTSRMGDMTVCVATCAELLLKVPRVRTGCNQRIAVARTMFDWYAGFVARTVQPGVGACRSMGLTTCLHALDDYIQVGMAAKTFSGQ